jgi:2-aminoethylphosphonate-pyruvate transaminase
MPDHLRSAVILAAGMGVRLREAVPEKPKGFIQIGGRTLIERSLDLLVKYGLEDVVIVTGHLAHFYDDLARDRDGIRVIRNDRYADSGSMYSLFCAGETVHGDFLLLESDLLFEGRAIQALVDCQHANAILMSGFTGSGDEVFIGTTGSRLEHMSKKKSELSNIAGELVGLSRISASMFESMKEFASERFRTSLHLEYEECMNGVAGTIEIHALRIEDLLWGEIDDVTHLKRVREEIFPAIREREKEGP